MRLWQAAGGHAPVSAEEKARLLQELLDLTQPSAVPSLVGLLYCPHAEFAGAAAQAIHRLLDTCPPLELPALDYAIRHMSDWRLQPLKTTEVAPLSRGLTNVLGVLASHGSGYVRQAAVEALARVGDGRELPFLLLRSNDWVAQVREVARAAVEDRLRPEYARHLVRCLPLIERLASQHRGNHEYIIKSASELLRGEGRCELLDGLSSEHREVRRQAFRLLREDAAGEALEVALGSGDAVLRLWAARELIRRTDDSSLPALVSRLKRDRFMPIRREALIAAAERLPQDAEPELIAALLDPHSSIRATAWFYLSRRGWRDIARFYRARLEEATGDKLPTVIRALGQMGAVEDAPRLALFLLHPSPKVRRAAVRAVGGLAADAYAETLLGALNDPAPSVAKAARRVLGTRPHLLAAGKLWAIVQGSSLPHARRAALELLGELPWWHCAPLLIEASASTEPQARDRALDVLRRRHQRDANLIARPGRERIRALENAVVLYGARLDTGMREDLHSLIAYAKRELGGSK